MSEPFRFVERCLAACSQGRQMSAIGPSCARPHVAAAASLSHAPDVDWVSLSGGVGRLVVPRCA